MRPSTFLSTIALLGGECAAQWDGYKTLRFDLDATNIDSGAIGGSSLISWANNSIWIGAIKQTIQAEPFIVALPKGSTYGPNMEFTSYHAWDFNQAVRPYVLLNESKPIQFVNLENGGAIPPQDSCNWSTDASGNLTLSGVNKIHGCRNAQTYQNTYELFWLGDGVPKGYNCTEKLYLNAAEGCTLVG